MKNFLKPTKVTWIIFGIMFLLSFGSIVAVFYFNAPPTPFIEEQPPLPGFVRTLTWIVIVLNLPTSLLSYPILKAYRLVGGGEFYFSAIFSLVLIFYWYLLGSTVSIIWYKLKPKKDAPNL